MSLAYYGKSNRRRGWLFIAALISVAVALLGGVVVRNADTADAATTATLSPDGQGFYTAWTNGEGELDGAATCAADADFVSTGTPNARESVNLDESTIPNGSTITSVAITVCYSEGGADNGQFQTFARLAGTDYDSGVTLSPTTTVNTSSIQNVAIPSVVKVSDAGLDLEIGVLKLSATAGDLEVYWIRAVVTYTEPAVAPTLSVAKAVPGTNAQAFAFTVVGSEGQALPAGDPSFSLADDGGGGLPATNAIGTPVVTGASDTYTITETAVAGWTLSSIDCTGADSFTPNLAGGSVSVTFGNGDTVACTFNNAQVVAPTLSVVKVVPGDNAQDFSFAISPTTGVSPTAFILDDDTNGTRSNSQAVTLPLGTASYTITEAAVAGWFVSSIVCTGADSFTPNLAGGWVSVTLGNNDTVVCTFDNVLGTPPVQPLPNPFLGQTCGLDMVLVLDSSGSIDAAELAQVKSAGLAFVGGFVPGTPSRIAVVEFDSAATLLQPLTNNTALLNAAVNSIASGGFTNWEAALNVARLQLTGGLDRPDNIHPDLIIIVTDGDPTYRGYPAAVDTGGDTDQEDIDGGVTAANLAKSSTAPIRIVAAGITGATVANLILISGPTLGSDYTIGGFDSLAATLSGLANDLCGGTVTVTKVADTNGNGVQDAGETTVDGWHFNATVSAGTITPNPANGNTAGGTVTFDIAFPLDVISVNAQVTETPIPAGWTFISATCQTGNGAVVPYVPGANVAVGANDIVNCKFYNQPPPVTRTVRVGKLTTTATHPLQAFAGTITPGGADTAFSVTLPADTATSPIQSRSVSTAIQTVVETPVPANWALDGYAVTADPGGQLTCSDTMAFTSNNVVPAGAANYLVCIKNTYTPPTRPITVTKVRLGNGPSAETFGGSISGPGATVDTTWSIATASGNNQTSQNRTVATNLAATIGETLTGAQTAAGWQVTGFTEVAGLGAACPATYNGVLDTTVPADTASYTYCVYNQYVTGSLQVTKSVNWANNPVDPSQAFTICITGPSYPAPTLGNGGCKSFTLTTLVQTWTDLSIGQYSISETGFGPVGGWTVGGGAGDAVTVAANQTATHTVTNTLNQLNLNVSICKVVVANGDNVFDGGQYGGGVSWSAGNGYSAGQGSWSDLAGEGAFAGPCDTSAAVPAGASFSLTETLNPITSNAAGYPGWSLDSTCAAPTPFSTEVPANTLTVYVCNKAVPVFGSLTIKKVIVNDNNGDAFTGTASPAGAFSITEAAPHNYTNLAVNTTYTVDESPVPAGYLRLGYALADGQGVCPAAATSTAATFGLSLTVASPNQTVCVYNEKYISVNVCKVIVENTDGLVQSGTFGGSLDWTGGGASWEDDATEGTTTPCDAVSVKFGAPLTVSETAIPVTWANAQGYPGWSLDPSCSAPNSLTQAADAPAADSFLYVCNKAPVRTINVCKYVADNGDAVLNEGGAFGGGVTPAGGSTLPWSVTGATEGGEVVCDTVDVAVGVSLTVTESSFPADWAGPITYDTSNNSGDVGPNDCSEASDYPASGGVTLATTQDTVLFCNQNDPAMRTITVQKVTDSTQHPAASFGYTSLPAGITGTLSLGLNVAASAIDTHSDVATTEVTITEDAPPDDWVNSGYAVIENGTTCAGAVFSATAGAVVPTSTSNYLVCIRNTYTKGTLIIRKVIVGGPGSGTFGGDVTGEGPVGTWSVTLTNDTEGDATGLVLPAGGYTVTETTIASGYELVSQGSCSEVLLVEDVRLLSAFLELLAEGPIVVAGETTTWCVYNQRSTGTVIVEKVRDTTANVPAADATQFSGTIGGGAGNYNWGPIGFAAVSTISNVLTGTYNLNETGFGNGWTPVGYALAVEGVCPAAKAAYVPGIDGFTVANDLTTRVCVMNTKDPQVVSGLLTIHKVIIGAANTTTNFSGSVSGGVNSTFNTLRSNNDISYSVQVTGDQAVNVTVAESDPSGLGYTRLGYRVAASTTACGTTANDASASVTVSFSNQVLVRVVCVYNQAISVPTPTPTPVTPTPTSTPTSTPTPFTIVLVTPTPVNTPTNTPTRPPAVVTNVVVIAPTLTPTATPTTDSSAISVVTPGAPSTGSGGIFGGSGGNSLVIGLAAALLAILTGTSLISMGRKRR
ncbi:MAG: vWA domain-containing protein [Dehalococcoidia bacterium]